MSNEHDAFIIPAGLVFETNDNGLVIENKGDIVLHSTLGHKLHRIRSTRGDVVVHLDTEVDQIEAPHGTVRVHGSLKAEAVTGDAIEIKGDVNADSVSAGSKGLVIHGDAVVEDLAAKGGGIEVHGNAEAGKLNAEEGDAIVHGDAQAKSILASKGNVILQGGGQAEELRASGLIECHGTVQVSHVESKDTVEFYDKVEANVVKSGKVKVASSEAKVKVVQAETAITVGAGRIQSDILIAPEIHLDPNSAGKVTVVECHNEIGSNSVKGCLRLADLEEMFGSADKFLQERGIHPLSGGGTPSGGNSSGGKSAEPAKPAAKPAAKAAPKPVVEAAEEAAKEPPTAEENEEKIVDDVVDDALHQQMVDTLGRITRCYSDAEVPPPVSRLEDLVSNKAYTEIRTDITDIWNQLIKYHQSKGLRMQSQVTTTFNAINNIIRKM